MNEVLAEINWAQVIHALWTIVLLPIITYVGAEIGNYTKAKRIDKYTDILYKNVVDAAKDIYETVVKDIKSGPEWTKEKQEEVKELAKNKAISALTLSMYQTLKAANSDFEQYLDGLIGTALYDLKRPNR